MEFIMVLQCNFMQKLEIPECFLTDFQESEHQISTLYSASLCKFWHVKIEHHGNKKYFCSGWDGFVKSHHLVEGNLLHFQYEGNLLFTVKTFSPSECCNTAYVSEEFTGQFRTNCNDQRIPIRAPENAVKKASTSCSKNINHVKPKISSKRKEMTTRTKKINSPTLERIIKPCNISKCSLRLPKMFTSAYGIDEWNDITMKVSNVDQWNMKVCHYGGQNWLTKGWITFLRANDLKVGDKCIFKHLSNHTMQVQMIKNKIEKSTDHLQKDNSEQQIPNLASDDAMKKPTGCSNENKHVKPKKTKEVTAQAAKISSPTLEQVIKPWHVSKGVLHLPKMFSSAYGIDEWNDITIMVSNGDQWNMRVCHCQGKNYLARLKQFIRANDLKVGDKCIFKHLSNHTMQVQIIKNENEKYTDQLQKVYSEQQISDHLVPEDTKKKLTSCSNKNKHVKPKFSSNNMELIDKAVKTKRDSAVLEWIIQPSELFGSYVDLLKNFCSAELNEVNEITMKDSDGNQWPIYLTTGWEKFVMANNIKAGDRCIFGPILDRIMQVQIVKN